MNRLDVMKRDKDRILAYWKERLVESRRIEKNRAYNIEIIPDTLEWFLWMIEGCK